MRSLPFALVLASCSASPLHEPRDAGPETEDAASDDDHDDELEVELPSPARDGVCRDGWSFDVVRPKVEHDFHAIVVYSAVLAVDESSRAHVAWSEPYWREGGPYSEALRYAVQAGGDWDAEDVLPREDLRDGRPSGLAVATGGLVYACWDMSFLPPAQCAVGRAGQWSLEDTGAADAYSMDLALGGDGVAHVVSSGWYSARRDGTWTVEPLSPRADPVVAVGPDAVPHILVTSGTGWNGRGMLRYGTRDGETWTFEDVAPIGDEWAVYDLDIDDDGIAHAVWVTSELHHGERTDAGWVITDGIDGREAQDRSTVGRPHVVVAPDGGVHVVYRSGTRFGLRDAVRREGEWRFDDVDPGAEVGTVALAIEPDGTEHVAYTDDGSLIHAETCDRGAR